MVREGETAIDLGANHAMWTWPLARAVGERGRVLAFEPVPYTAGTLSLVIRRLGLSNVDLIQKGVGASAGEATFLVPFQPSGVTEAGRAHLAQRNDAVAAPGRMVRAEIVRLDDFLDRTSSVTLIKADIEGAELFAFQDAVELIERDAPTIVCEIDPNLLRGFGLVAGDVMEFFSNRDYKMLRYEQTSRELTPVTDPASVDRGNYLFVHSSRFGRLSDFVRGTRTGSLG
jgi:FkbM family methyltransferase